MRSCVSTPAAKPLVAPPSRKKQRRVILDGPARAAYEVHLHQQLCTPVYLPISEDEAIVLLQRHCRRYRIKKQVSEMYCKQIITK